MNLTFLLSALYFLNCSHSETISESNDKETTLSQTENSEFEAKVIRIVDGDTLEVLYGELPVMIRLQHIDCPEKKQAFGTKAKQTLSDLCFGQNVKLEYESKDRNGRYICVIFNEKGINVNKEMIRLGMAWHFKKYSTDSEYAELETEARKNKVGLWQDPKPIPPWDWRKIN